MGFRLTACPVSGCKANHGVIYERKAARKASDDSAGSGADSGDIGCLPGPLRSEPVGTFPVSESRKALSTTG